jgi:hypothetical protein
MSICQDLGMGKHYPKKLKEQYHNLNFFSLDLEIICHACVHQDIEIVVRERAQML